MFEMTGYTTAWGSRINLVRWGTHTEVWAEDGFVLYPCVTKVYADKDELTFTDANGRRVYIELRGPAYRYM